MEQQQINKTPIDIVSAQKDGIGIEDIAKKILDTQNIDYDDLVLGELKKNQNLEPGEKALTADQIHDQIIMRYAETLDGQPYTNPNSFRLFTESALEGLAKSGAGLAGGMMGFKIGALTGPLSPVVTPFTTIGGAIAGDIFADNIFELFNFEDNVVPSKRPIQISGETGGGTAAFSISPFLAARLVMPGTINWMKQNARDFGGKVSSTFLEKLGYTALKNPGLTAGIEGVSAVGSSIGAQISEEEDPGDEFKRFTREMFYGTVAGPVVFQLGPAIVTGGLNLIKTAKGREGYVGRELKKIIEEGGGDPKKVLDLIDESIKRGILDSPAAITGEKGLISLNKTLFKDFPALQPALKAELQRNLRATEALILKMIDTQDPTIIAEAAKLRNKLYKAKVGLRITDARLKITNIINKRSAENNTSENVGVLVSKIMNQAIKDVRDEEQKLYKLIPNNVTFNTANTKQVLLDLLNPQKKNSLLPGELEELGIKKSGLQILNKIIGTTETKGKTFQNLFLEADNATQESFLKIIGYSPQRVTGVSPNVSNRWSLDKSIIEDDFGLEKGSLKNLTIDDLKNKNFDKIKSAQYSQEVIDNSAEEGVTLGLFGDNRKDVEQLFDELSTKHLQTLRNDARNFQKSNRSLAKLIDASVTDFTKTLPESGDELAIDTSRLTINEVLNLRSQIFSAAKEQSTAGNTRNAHFLNKIANSLTDDIGLRAEDGTDDVTKLIKNAHAFSLALNDTFTRGFPNTLLKKTKSGRLAVIPELAVNSILKGGGDAVSYNFNGLESGIQMLAKGTNKELAEEYSKKLGTLSGAQEDILQLAFTQIIDFDTNTVNPQKLARFMSPAEYGKVLERFPALKKDLSDLQTAQKLFDDRKALYGDFNQYGGVLGKGRLSEKKNINKIFTFADFLPNETNPGLVIANAIGTPEQRPGNPVGNLKRLIAFAKKTGNKDVLTALKEVIIDRGYQYSLYGKDNLVDFKAFKDYLFKPIAKGQDSVFGILRKEGVIDGDEALRFNTIFNRIITNQKALPDATVGPLDRPLVRGTQAFVDLIGRLVGSKIGTSVGEMIPGRGQGIIEASAGVRSVLGFLNVPASKTQELFLRAAQDPEFFKMLVTKAANEKEALVLARRVRAYILDSGLGFLSSEAEKQITGEESGVPPLPRQFDPKFLPGVTGSIDERSSVQPNQEGSPTTQIGQGLTSGVNNRLAANVGTPPPAASIDRNKFASLFPNDPISGLINAQQQGTTQFMKYGGMAGNPSFDMGLETDVTAQQAIQSALEDNKTRDDDQDITTLPSTLTTNTGSKFTGITGINNPLARSILDFVTGKKNVQPFVQSTPTGRGFIGGAIIPFQNGGFVDDDSEIGMEDDSQITQSDFDYLSSLNEVDFDAYASAPDTATGIASVIAQPQVGGGRSNIRGSKNYDPIYAQALNITRGLLPGNKVASNYLGAEKFQGFKDLTRPPSLIPQVPGALDMRAGYGYERPMFFSGLEKFAIQDAPDLVRQAMDMGIMGLARKAGDYFSSNFSKLFGGDEEVTPQKVKAQDKDITANDIIGNPNYSINIRRLAGEPLSDILKSRSR